MFTKKMILLKDLNFAGYIDLKIILLDHENNFVGNSNWNIKFFAALHLLVSNIIILIILVQ